MKKKIKLIRATTSKSPIFIDGKEIKFKKNGTVDIFDPGLGKEINQRFGFNGELRPGLLAVAEVDSKPDVGHVRMFTVPELPWKKDKK